eukprot:CAMPEP_0115131936 /NCGR_PEP_ID=MMETSP0227-20121206/53431_1 /TAXON_ID=89957 /ORGANISM="Polarella glacialis, Strain CCMP 1383" /LENGTH=255 /DNA_ID=CAMNT_0002537587 /DNA_START=1 /DNA_END=768 /DNA_ORIENTATION=+
MLLQNEDGGSRQTFFLGQEFVDQDTKRSVQGVITSSGIMAGFQVIATLLILGSRVSPRKLESAFINLLAGLALPACGFFGATRSNPNMMCCFCGTNLVAAICQFLTLLMFVTTIYELDHNKEEICEASCRILSCGNSSSLCSCERDCLLDRTRGQLQCCPDFTEVCYRGVQEEGPLSCAEIESQFGQATFKLAIMVVVFMLPATCLSGYAFYHGSVLWRRLSDGDQLVPSRSAAVAADDDGRVATADEEDALGVE